MIWKLGIIGIKVQRVKENASRKHDAVMKRERALAYAFSYQVSEHYYIFY
jgi:hypothetical protein